MAAITAKVKVFIKTPNGDNAHQLTFGADYAGGANKEWADATPYIDVRMSVKNEVAELFAPGQSFTLTFTPDDPESSAGDGSAAGAAAATA